MELVALMILAVPLFGPDKLPELIQNVTGFLRKVRELSDSAKQDIRSELGPESRVFEFEDLHPKRFVHKHVLGSDGLGLEELRDALDPRKELTQIADAVREAADISTENVPATPGVDLAKDVAPAKRVTLAKEGAATSERPLFDPETT
ncbi:Sec-independent protein translocase subunit TatB [Streptomyces sp. NPDC059426]|uniref:Sec-independent protein translocase subunit TatB n=1 Tax=Streptomyces sp. NPDC059426 TaxID=3346827 RepID=UPI0036888B08